MRWLDNTVHGEVEWMWSTQSNEVSMEDGVTTVTFTICIIRVTAMYIHFDDISDWLVQTKRLGKYS